MVAKNSAKYCTQRTKFSRWHRISLHGKDENTVKTSIRWQTKNYLTRKMKKILIKVSTKNQRHVFNALFSGLVNEEQQQPNNNLTRASRVSFNVKLPFLCESSGKIKLRAFQYSVSVLNANDKMLMQRLEPSFIKAWRNWLTLIAKHHCSRSNCNVPQTRTRSINSVRNVRLRQVELII